MFSAFRRCSTPALMVCHSSSSMMRGIQSVGTGRNSFGSSAKEKASSSTSRFAFCQRSIIPPSPSPSRVANQVLVEWDEDRRCRSGTRSPLLRHVRVSVPFLPPVGAYAAHHRDNLIGRLCRVSNIYIHDTSEMLHRCIVLVQKQPTGIASRRLCPHECRQ